MNPALYILSLLWKTLVVRHGVEWVSEQGNSKLDRLSYWSALSVVTWLTVLELSSGILGLIFPFALPLYWLVFGLSFFLIFSEYFGLGLWRSTWMFPVIVIGDWVFAWLGRLL